ncbi:hypothetical protein BGX28_005768 [Mortierella sp. GBA30]|nr:hypothetical protein BGX28_005768 [Mortierella sp. GBA30]
MTLHSSNDNATYVIKYMSSMGRAYAARAMLHLSGSEYRNEFVTAEQVAADRAAAPFGRVPVLVVNRPDGSSFELGESIAIEHYLAEKLGLLSSDMEVAALMKSVAFNIYFELYHHCFAAKIPIQEAVQDPNSEFNTKALPEFIACHERWLMKNGNNGHYFGNELSYPDLSLCKWVRLMEALGVTQIKENSPIKKLEQTVKAMEEWKGKYDDFHPFKVLDA